MERILLVPNMQKNIHVSDVEWHVMDTLDGHTVLEAYDQCPHCATNLNFWGYGYYEAPETKTARLLQEFAMWRSGWRHWFKEKPRYWRRKWTPCSDCGKRWTHKRTISHDSMLCVKCSDVKDGVTELWVF